RIGRAGSTPASAKYIFDGSEFLADKKIQAILFDIGETLLNFGKVETIALFEEGGKHAHEFLGKLNQPVGSQQIFLLKHLWMIRAFRAWSYLTGKDFDSLALLKKMEQKKGAKLSEKQWEEYGWQWYEPLSKFAKVEPDIKQTLEKLKQAGMKLGILSNTFINAVTLERHLAQFGILEFLTTRVYSYQFNFRKPDSRIFIEAAKKMECEPANVLFVGDRLDLDIAGARAANMPAVIKRAYTNINKDIPQNVIKIERLAELPEIVEEINSH
ncbi:MAG: HAD family hydrolase, partial [Phycisphaerae bacterium]|nr:HAD family hydrolase [Phycisphaerae bacterium]